MKRELKQSGKAVIRELVPTFCPTIRCCLQRKQKLLMPLFNFACKEDDLEVFVNDTPLLFKYADDSTIVAPVWKDSDTSADLVNQFLSWSINQMLCNPGKCKELTFRKKESSGTRHQYASINNIPQCDILVLLGLTFQPNCKFSEHVKLKLTKANKCLHILRTLRKELFSQNEIDHLFKTLVLPILIYGLAVYGASDYDLNFIQTGAISVILPLKQSAFLVL